MSKEKMPKVVRYTLLGLPLIGAAAVNFLNISARTNQMLVLIALLWFQAFILLEVFFTGK